MICNFMIFSESVGSGARLSAKPGVLQERYLQNFRLFYLVV